MLLDLPFTRAIVAPGRAESAISPLTLLRFGFNEPEIIPSYLPYPQPSRRTIMPTRNPTGFDISEFKAAASPKSAYARRDPWARKYVSLSVFFAAIEQAC